MQPPMAPARHVPHSSEGHANYEPNCGPPPLMARGDDSDSDDDSLSFLRGNRGFRTRMVALALHFSAPV